jgi:hypothetical protein
MFNNRVDLTYNLTRSKLQNKLQVPLADVDRIIQQERLWRMYKGYHWDGMEELGKAETTINYCRAIIDKLSSFELSKGFTIKMHPSVEKYAISLINDVWDNQNCKETILEMHGQIKNVTGKVWHRIDFINPSHVNYEDVYGEYPQGYFKITTMLPSLIFPEYDVHNSSNLIKLTVAYSYEQDKKTINYKQEWNRDEVVEYINNNEVKRYDNKYKVIPFFECINIGVAGEVEGQSDLDDIIPLNIEMNLKTSDVSEIIDYHASPVTIIFGAYADNMEKGANKVWSGLPVDAKVQNLELKGDLGASREFIKDLKEALQIVAKVPAIAMGEGAHISNTSGVALETVFAPLIDVTLKKRGRSGECFAKMNKFIIHVALMEGLIEYPENETSDTDDKIKLTKNLLFKNEVIFGEPLAKDGLVELQKIQLEMKLGLENREGAMKRLGKADIVSKLAQIDADREKYPDIYGLLDEGENIMNRGLNENNEGGDAEVNAGLQNSPESKK